MRDSAQLGSLSPLSPNKTKSSPKSNAASSIVAGAEAQVDANLRRAERLRQSILKQAFSGGLVPQDEGDEPTSVLLERIRTKAPSPQPLSQRARGIKAAPLPRGEGGRRPGEGEPASAAGTAFTCIDDVTAAILAHMQPGHDYARAELADPLGLSTGQWNAAIQELKRIGKVRQTGEKRGARYQRT
ncbi:hypothetical protein JCM30471_26660 [Desulfuromonas carbonis]|uniref:hypothetical protein n=1 Tax=Desulfuromonas sp. DDH964 TaxID=1823759 RepID=UPI00078EC149|nr:hypothetical protein [Desulfuromonas sp. DDH964]AMV70861.1 hypothetical protein DBW_0460 [Desulfuromonas sp. DDH964]